MIRQDVLYGEVCQYILAAVHLMPKNSATVLPCAKCSIAKYPIYLRMDLDLECTLQTKPTSQCRLWATICVIKLRIHGQYSSRNGHAMVIKSLRYRREENIARLLIMPSRQQRKFPPNR